MYRCIYCNEKFDDEPVIVNGEELCPDCVEKIVYEKVDDIKAQKIAMKNNNIVCLRCNVRLQFVSNHQIATMQAPPMKIIGSNGGGPLIFSRYVCPVCKEYSFFEYHRK